MNKIFILGLPRTGTTSVSVALLSYGFKVAHTAYTKRAFELADVISDAPCFADYKELDRLFPNSRFVYLDRAEARWIPSMQRLLKKMLPELHPKTGYLNPILKRVIEQTFAISTAPDPLDAQHLAQCYRQHQKDLFSYFLGRKELLTIDVSEPGALTKLLEFLNTADGDQRRTVGLNVDVETRAGNTSETDAGTNADQVISDRKNSDDIDVNETSEFPLLNTGAQVDFWQRYKHPNKIHSLTTGKDHRTFFDY